MVVYVRKILHLRVESNEETGQTILKGIGELHLDIIVDRMKREFGVETKIGAPQVAYRETITKSFDIDYTHKKQSGGSGQFARVKMILEPKNLVKVLHLKAKLLAVTFLKNISLVLKKA